MQDTHNAASLFVQNQKLAAVSFFFGELIIYYQKAQAAKPGLKGIHNTV